MPKYVYTFILVGFYNVLFASLDPPKIRCIALDENNGVTLTWDIPLDTSNVFYSYRIFYKAASSGGGFTQLYETLNYLESSHAITGSFSGSGKFFMVTMSNLGTISSLTSDTISPILVSIFSDNRFVELQWTELNLESLDSTYRVHRRIDTGAWQLIGNIAFPDRKILDTINRCHATVTYKVEVNGIGGCVSVSNFASKVIEDQAPPEQTNIFCASVDSANGSVHLAWWPSVSEDTRGYLIYYFGIFTRSDTINRTDSLKHIFTTSGINALKHSETLSAAPFDSCENSLTGWYNQAADANRISTLFLDTNYYDRCEGKVGLQWNMPRKELPVGVNDIQEFIIYRKIGNGEETMICALSSTDSVFTDSGLVYGKQYFYRVSAIDKTSGCEAFSNPRKLKVAKPNAPEFLYISSIQNNHESGKNCVFVRTDTTNETKRFILERSLDLNGEYQEIEYFESDSSARFYIVDNGGKPGQTDYYYRVLAYDVCENIIRTSSPVKSILVDGYKNEEFYLNELRWTDFDGLQNQGGVFSWKVLNRSVNGDSNREIFSSKKEFSFEDDISEVLDIGGEICYYVKVPQLSPDSFGVMDTTVSNLFCVYYSPRSFIPNAFTPDGDQLNDVFMPDLNYLDPTEFSMRIFDRSGVLVFESDNITKGWDGIGQSIGVYVYQIIINNSRGEPINYVGKVALIR